MEFNFFEWILIQIYKWLKVFGEGNSVNID